jgi:hypothetical protein
MNLTSIISLCLGPSLFMVGYAIGVVRGYRRGTSACFHALSDMDGSEAGLMATDKFCRTWLEMRANKST